MRHLTDQCEKKKKNQQKYKKQHKEIEQMSSSQIFRLSWPDLNKQLRVSCSKSICIQFQLRKSFMGEVWVFKINGILLHIQHVEDLYLRVCVANRQPFMIRLSQQILSQFCIGCFIVDGEMVVPCLDQNNCGQVQICVKLLGGWSVLWEKEFQSSLQEEFIE
eukprot:TRINITY_DN25798_c1_g2_i2.p2 TRINITY_DN25798_c1_g2~~TRINITY_DN25798_c1_g2_i2.p2  ORF type:complete len:162 (-),score=2.76 TRINITY_DN25798_c1_g2_i2:259-744(-)